MPSYSQAKGHDGRWGVMASDLVGRPLHRARGGHDLLIRRSMEGVRPVRRNPYWQVSILPGVRWRRRSPVPSGQSVRKL